MSSRYQAGIVLPGYNALKVANAPTIGTATAASGTSVSVTFTAPACVGGGAISAYTVFANCGIYKTTGASSPLVVTGLTSGSSYTFKTIATNAYGPSYPSAASNSATTFSVPGAPTIGTASITSGSTTASVPFTAPASDGGTAITLYTATSSPGGLTGTLSQAGSGTVSVSGLTVGTAYTFTVTATNAVGTGPASAASNSITPTVVTGQQAYTTGGSYTWVAPAGVTSVSAVVVGGGARSAGSNAGSLRYKNNIAVTPGNSYCVSVGAATTSFCGNNSWFISQFTVLARGGNRGTTQYGDGGGNSGTCSGNAGGAGAGGYSGNGGNGANSNSNGTAGSGGGGGGGATYGAIGGCCNWYGGGGGGVGILGESSSGAGGTLSGATANGGGGGSGGASGTSGPVCGFYKWGGNGGNYGGGMAAASSGLAPGATSGGGAVRIIWPGTTRSFPSTNTGNL